MKKYVVVSVVVLFVFAVVVGVFANDIVWDDIGKGNVNLRTVLVSSDDSQVIYVGSSNAVLKSEDAGVSWRNILLVRGSNRGVNFLAFALGNNNSLYAATRNGLYFSHNQGRNWSRIFKGKSYFENECTTLAVLPSVICLGTKAGLFSSKDKGRSWHKETAKLGKSHILAIAYSLKEPDYIYVACVDGVYKTVDAGQSWERVFVAHITEDTNGNNDEEGQDEDRDEKEQFSDIRYISIDPDNLNYLYLATSKGVYKSKDKGLTWEAVSCQGLLSQDVRFLLVTKNSRLYAATKSGVFEYKTDQWQELSLRLAVGEVNFLDTDSQDNLYAACDKGLFKTNAEYFDNTRHQDLISLYCKNESGIAEVQLAAIKYCEVEPEKIARWRRQAAKRAWLPKVTIDMDRDIDRTISNSIWGTSGTNSSPGKYFVGPDDETKYNNKNWGVSLTWELGDLIFSDDQTDIDVRSRLMVQLRNDILDEVTKLYFERLRVKMELDSLSIEDRKKRLEKELRLKELTASLDALSGGYFSRQQHIECD